MPETRLRNSTTSSYFFHSIALILLFSATSWAPNRKGHFCKKKSWIPSLCSLVCSLGIIWAIRFKIEVDSHLEKLLEIEKEDGQLLAKCMEELKKKGVEFDLQNEVDAFRRAKSLRVESGGLFEMEISVTGCREVVGFLATLVLDNGGGFVYTDGALEIWVVFLCGGGGGIFCGGYFVVVAVVVCSG
ncbi:unnamed protein product [Fraxinus pennsylvanica]|uniref:Transmembrane protein n=1 Tax=Fraxinus pennsylvanica TaxID=56036 RepID=A0AAD1ZKX4_9LAMI|nr:unnamed protein product [Fraxinus pennsylvanica]